MEVAMITMANSKPRENLCNFTASSLSRDDFETFQDRATIYEMGWIDVKENFIWK
jgi:hypothetical protein